MKHTQPFLAFLVSVSVATAAGAAQFPIGGSKTAEDTKIMMPLVLKLGTENPSTPSPSPTPQPSGGVDTGFRPKPDGFQFENYTNQNNPVNLTPVEMQKLFGNAVCASLQNDECILTPPAQQWMERQNASMNGGHCEGLGVLSTLMFTGYRASSNFGGNTTFDINLEGNTILQREIAYWFVTQATDPSSTTENKTQSPSQVLEQLAQEFAKPKATREYYVLGIYKPGYRDGHAITPYALVEKGNNIVWIMAYDNNFPDQERYVEVNRATNTWRYTTATNPNEQTSEYIGDANSFTLTLAPISIRKQQQNCTFCESANPYYNLANGQGGAIVAQPKDEIWLEGNSADLLITNANGKRLGFVQSGNTSNFVNEISGSEFIPIKTNFNTDHEPVYRVSGTIPYTISLDGSRVVTKEASNLTVIGAGYVLGVDGISLDKGQKDQLLIESAQAQRIYTMTYKTQQNETPTIFIGIETTAADYFISIQAAGDAAGQNITLGLNHTTGQLAIKTTRTSGNDVYAVRVERITSTGSSLFTHSNIGMIAGATDYLNYATWAGNGQPLTLSVDNNNDGVIDETILLTDEN
jgi:hypothetical protein